MTVALTTDAHDKISPSVTVRRDSVHFVMHSYGTTKTNMGYHLGNWWPGSAGPTRSTTAWTAGCTHDFVVRQRHRLTYLAHRTRSNFSAQDRPEPIQQMHP